VSSPKPPHIAYPRFRTALQAHQLRFILEHSAQITMSLADEIEVCQLIARENPDRLEPSSAQWIGQFAERLLTLTERGTGR